MLSSRFRALLVLGLTAVLAGGCATRQTVEREPDEQAAAGPRPR